MTDRIAKEVELKVPLERVWRALTNHREFGEWFRVKLDQPFVAGEISHGHITYPGYEHLQWKAWIQAIHPEKRFAFTWHPYAIDPTVDYSNEPLTLVEFTLEKTANGTLLRVAESGFDAIPGDRRDEAFRMNEHGWGEQMKNIERYLTAST